MESCEAERTGEYRNLESREVNKSGELVKLESQENGRVWGIGEFGTLESFLLSPCYRAFETIGESRGRENWRVEKMGELNEFKSLGNWRVVR